MRKFFVILGGQSQERKIKVARPAKRQRAGPNLDILKKSPCLGCELFIRDTACPYVRGCSKIDEFQRLAAAHCTLCKSEDMLSVA
jgi:hypothetical protein